MTGTPNKGNHIACNPAGGQKPPAASFLRLGGFYSFCHQYVRFPQTVRVTNYAHNCKSELLIESHMGAREGPAHPLSRLRGWITPPPRKTRFRMTGLPCPGGNDYPLGPSERFQAIPSSFPRLRLAHPNSNIKWGQAALSKSKMEYSSEMVW